MWILVAAGAAMALLTIAAWEQLCYIRKAAHLPGPNIVLPFLGNVVTMVWDAPKFWEKQAFYARKSGDGLSWNVLFGRFIIFVSSAELSHKVFTNIRPDAFQLIGHPFGKPLFGKKNLISMFGEPHKELRQHLLPLFTLKALDLYIPIQERAIRRHITKWLEDPSGFPKQLQSLLRKINLETSQDVFVGPYLEDTTRQQLTRDYNIFNRGLMTVPINFPGFAFYEAAQAVKRLVDELACCVTASRKAMLQGSAPACLLDFWMLGETGNSTDREIGQHLFDFLFAAQDASTSSLVWLSTLLEANPTILELVRQEQLRIRSNFMAEILPAQLREMKYTEMVVKETLRFRPPAAFVPHVAMEDFLITESYIVPKGTMIFPSPLESSYQGFQDADTFDPQRFSPPRQEEIVYKKNWLIFGAGAHQCLGQRYAMNQLVLFAAIFSMSVEWEWVQTPDCNDFSYVPTLAPKDGCLVVLKVKQGET